MKLLKQNISNHISLLESDMEAFGHLFKPKTILKKNFFYVKAKIVNFKDLSQKGFFGYFKLTLLVLSKFCISL